MSARDTFEKAVGLIKTADPDFYVIANKWLTDNYPPEFSGFLPTHIDPKGNAIVDFSSIDNSNFKLNSVIAVCKDSDGNLDAKCLSANDDINVFKDISMHFDAQGNITKLNKLLHNDEIIDEIKNALSKNARSILKKRRKQVTIGGESHHVYANDNDLFDEFEEDTAEYSSDDSDSEHEID
jgi:hypothetical protein